MRALASTGAFVDDYAIYGFPGDDDTLPFFEQALDALVDLGATLVDTDTGDIFAYAGDEFMALLFEFKVDIAAYLSGLGHTSMRTLSDLSRSTSPIVPPRCRSMARNCSRSQTRRAATLPIRTYLAAGGSTSQPERVSTARCRRRGSTPSSHHTFPTRRPAVAGYPNLALPVGITPEANRPEC